MEIVQDAQTAGVTGHLLTSQLLKGAPSASMIEGASSVGRFPFVKDASKPLADTSARPGLAVCLPVEFNFPVAFNPRLTIIRHNKFYLYGNGKYDLYGSNNHEQHRAISACMNILIDPLYNCFT